MKLYRRCFSLLLCLVLLLSVFSVNAFASSVVETQPFHVYGQVTFEHEMSAEFDGSVVASKIWYPKNDNFEEQLDWQITENGNNIYYSDSVDLIFNYTIANDNNTPLLINGNTYDISISDIYWNTFVSIAYSNGSTKRHAIGKDELTQVQIYAVDSNGTRKLCTGSKFNISGVYANITTSITPDANIEKLEIALKFNLKPLFETPIKSYILGSNLGEDASGDPNWVMTFGQGDPYEEELEGIKGVLGGIIEWIQSIWSSINDGFSALGDSISSLGDNISNAFSQLWEWLGNIANTLVELPAMIWGYIQDGIMYLFVPSDEEIEEYKEEWSNLLENRFGAVWQIMNLLSHCFDGVNESAKSDTISIPLTTIPLPQGNEFSFGGYDVKVVPDGFEFFADAVQLAVGCVGTLMFVNGVRKRYDEVFH